MPSTPLHQRIWHEVRRALNHSFIILNALAAIRPKRIFKYSIQSHARAVEFSPVIPILRRKRPQKAVGRKYFNLKLISKNSINFHHIRSFIKNLANWNFKGINNLHSVIIIIHLPSRREATNNLVAGNLKWPKWEIARNCSLNIKPVIFNMCSDEHFRNSLSIGIIRPPSYDVKPHLDWIRGFALTVCDTDHIAAFRQWRRFPFFGKRFIRLNKNICLAHDICFADDRNMRRKFFMQNFFDVSRSERGDGLISDLRLNDFKRLWFDDICGQLARIFTHNAGCENG